MVTPPGVPVPRLGNPLHEEIFPNLQSKPPLAQAEVMFSCPVASCLAETGPTSHPKSNAVPGEPKQPCTPMGRGKQTFRRFGLCKREQSAVSSVSQCCSQPRGPWSPAASITWLGEQDCFPQPARVAGAKFKMANEKRAGSGPWEPFWSWRLSKPVHLEKREPGSAGIAGNNSNLCSYVSRFFPLTIK